MLDTMLALSIISISIAIGIMTFNNLFKKESLISSYKSIQQMKDMMINSEIKYENISFSEERFDHSDILIIKKVVVKKGKRSKEIESIVFNWDEN